MACSRSTRRWAGPGGLALFGCLAACSCYAGSARSINAGALASDWEIVVGVPEVRQSARKDCGAAALRMVLGYWGRPLTLDEVRAAVPAAGEGGIQVAALRQVARAQGLRAFVIEGRLTDIERELARQRPILVGVMKTYRRRVYPHYEVVVGINRREQRILTLDPAHGLRVNGSDGFAAEWAAAGYVALIIIP